MGSEQLATNSEQFSFVASEDNRIDKVLAGQLNSSRNQVEKLIEKGFVSINDKVISKTSQKVYINDIVSYLLPQASQKEAMNIDFDIEILYEDEYLMVVNKPSNLVVHPAPSVKEPTLVDWLIKKGISLSTISGEERHGIVHRIDKDTTGALVIAKTNEAHEALSLQLEDKTMGRYYLAIIDYPLKEDITIEENIARNSTNRLKMAVAQSGRFAKSAFAKLSLGKNDIELIAAKLYTGRTHQIRVHLAHLGRHILGDNLYGYRGKDMPRVFLHARLIYFKHPATNEIVEFEAPLFDDMKEFLDSNFETNYIDLVTPRAIKGVFSASC